LAEAVSDTFPFFQTRRNSLTFNANPELARAFTQPNYFTDAQRTPCKFPHNTNTAIPYSVLTPLGSGVILLGMRKKKISWPLSKVVLNNTPS